MIVYYSPKYVMSATHFDTTRKAKWVADSLATSPIPGIQLTEPPSLMSSELVPTHDWEYVCSIRDGQPRELAESQGFAWDRRLWPMVLSSNGGVVAAALAALTLDKPTGSLSSGLHHARRDSGAGFCTFNGLAIAARMLQKKAKILILDLDAHCGGGTASLIAGYDNIRQIDISTNSFDDYPDDDQSQLIIVNDESNYLPTIREVLNRTDRFDLCLYNAGMDPIVPADILAERERIVFDWCAKKKMPVAFCLAGGYLGLNKLKVSELVSLHRHTLLAAV